jgi:SAM-dependent methyltransferase
MSAHVCPWWLGWVLASPLRKLRHDPAAILHPYVREGMTVLEPGPGMGFFTLELARRVGPTGRVIAIDVQPRMLSGLRRRVRRAGLDGRVEARLTAQDALGVVDLAGAVDLVVAFAVVHELPDPTRFFAEIRPTLAPGGKVFLAEPAGHVKPAEFERTLGAAASSGLRREPGPAIPRTLTALLAATGPSRPPGSSPREGTAGESGSPPASGR